MPDSYIVYYRPGPNWVMGQPMKNQPLKSHLEYLLSLHERGKLLMGGPFADESGGLVVFNGSTVSEIETMVANDPAVYDGILVASVKKWTRVV